MSIFVRLCEKNAFHAVKTTQILCATYASETFAPTIDDKNVDSGKISLIV